MATGYTCIIEKGVSFKDFASHCARAFGALISMKDDPSDAKIPEEIKPNPYHYKEWQKAKEEFVKAQKMTLKEAKIYAKIDYEKSVEDRKKAIKEKRALRAKYENMLSQVQKWVPPTNDHVNFKNFMVSQITQSIEWDCDEKYNTVPVLASPKEYRKDFIDGCEKDIKYHFEKYQKELEQCAKATKWIRDLKNSLK